MEDTEPILDTTQQEYLRNPNRVSILTERIFMKPTIEQLARLGLRVDFRFSSISSMERQRQAIARDGLGVLAVIGRTNKNDLERRDQTRHVPFILKQLGLEDTPTVHIPLSSDQVLRPEPIDRDGYTYTRTLDLTDGIRFNPRRILEEGAILVRSLVELPTEVI